MTSRDNWQKAEIASKVVGAVLVPFLIAFFGLTWNARISSEQANYARLELAMRILWTEPLAGGSDAIVRKWAIAVIKLPSDPPSFPDQDEVLLEIFATGSAVCSATKVDRQELQNALLKNHEQVPNEVGEPAASLLLGMAAGCKEKDWPKK